MPVAQAQKEIFVNEAHARIDGLLHIVVEGNILAPPADAVDGQCWIIGAGASGEFQGKADQLAFRQLGQWFFAPPRIGMRAYNRSAGQSCHYDSGWTKAEVVTGPAGGSVIDVEARASISGIMQALQASGILPQD